MTATKDLEVPSRSGDRFGLPALAGKRFFGRALVAITAAGAAIPAGQVGAVAIMGLAEEGIDNTDGQTGDQIVNCMKGVFRANVTAADYDDISKPVYATDDDTLQLTNGGGELLAGTLVAIDADGVWVRY